MKGLDVDVEFIGSGIDEPPPRDGEAPIDYVCRLSKEKAQEVARSNPRRIVVGADTSVVLGSEVLGKPADEREAVGIITRLRGQEHFVITGVTVLDGESGQWKSSHKSTRIVMRQYADEEIARYVATGDCMDKAGGYAVQDENFRPASRVEGCYLNAVGFPLCEVMELLTSLGLKVEVRQDWNFPIRFDGCSALPVKKGARR